MPRRKFERLGTGRSGQEAYGWIYGSSHVVWRSLYRILTLIGKHLPWKRH